MQVSELSLHLGIDGKTLRRFLRSTYGRAGEGHRWDLSDEQVEEVRDYFEGSGTQGSRTPLSQLVPPLVRRQAGPGLEDLVRNLRDQPQDVVVPTFGGGHLRFHRIMQKWDMGGVRKKGHRVALLSNGEFFDSRSLSSPRD